MSAFSSAAWNLGDVSIIQAVTAFRVKLPLIPKQIPSSSVVIISLACVLVLKKIHE